MRTRCPAPVSSRAPAGVNATRSSSVLISLATPMIMVDHSFTLKRLHHANNTPRLARATKPKLKLEVVHHVLNSRVVLEAVYREILAVPGLLKTTVGHLGDQGNVGVH